MSASANDFPTELEIWINNKKVNFTVSNKDFSEVTIGNFKLIKGENKIKILVKSNSLKLDWFKFN
ncbi:hypothetical protein D3C86_1690080 [compost metagenome]